MHSPSLVPCRVSAEAFLTVSPDEAWRMVGDFGNAEWVPGTARCEVIGEGVGAERVLTTTEGVRIRERLLSHDPATRHYTYTLEEAPMALDAYEARVEAAAAGTGSRVRWSATFQAPEAHAEAITQGLGALFESAMRALEAHSA